MREPGILEGLRRSKGCRDDFIDAQPLAISGHAAEQFRRAPEQARRRAEPLAVDAVSGLAVMVLQMHEATGELDERLVEDVAFTVRSQPDVFEDIMGGVILLRVEETEVFEITRMESAGRVHIRHARGDAVVLAHGDQAASSAA